MSLRGKNAVVTGGTGGLGAVVVRRFVDEGMNITISYHSVQELSRLPDRIQTHITAVRADVTMESDVQQLFDAATSKGPIDIVVNTVGGFVPGKAITDVTVGDWDSMMNLNLKSTFLCTREALRRMNGQTYGRIVNLSSMSGLNPVAGRSAYIISKSAVSLFTEIAALEQRGSGITVNAIAPSIIDTAANRQSMPDEDFTRWVKPDHLADIICYLCSQEAKDVTGTTIKAAGGL